MKLAFFKQHRLVLEIGQVWVAAMVANLLLYLFLLIVGRSLGPKDYSLLGSLFGIVYLTSALPNAVQVSMAKFVAGSKASVSGADTAVLVTAALLRVFILGGGFFVVFSLASPFIGSYLHSDSVVPILTTGVLIFVSLLIPVVLGALQGAQRFHLFASILLLYAGARLVFGVAALGMKLGITGVLAAVSLSTLLTTAMGLAMVRPSIRVSLTGLGAGGFTKVLTPALIGTVAFALPGSADVVIVRHFFSAGEAGLYTGASVLGRVVLFLPMAVSTVLFPKIARDWALGNTGRGLLYRGLGLTTLLSGGVCLAFVLLPGLALSLFFGNEYMGAQGLVPLYAAAMFLFSLSIVFLHYHLATGQTAYFYLLLLPHLVLEVALIYIFHQSLTHVLLALLSVNISLAILSQAFTQVTAARAPTSLYVSHGSESVGKKGG